MTSGAVMVASTVIRPPQVGQRKASNPHVRLSITAHSTYLAQANSSPSFRRPECATEIVVGSTIAAGSAGTSAGPAGIGTSMAAGAGAPKGASADAGDGVGAGGLGACDGAGVGDASDAGTEDVGMGEGVDAAGAAEHASTPRPRRSPTARSGRASWRGCPRTLGRSRSRDGFAGATNASPRRGLGAGWTWARSLALPALASSLSSGRSVPAHVRPVLQDRPSDPWTVTARQRSPRAPHEGLDLSESSRVSYPLLAGIEGDDDDAPRREGPLNGHGRLDAEEQRHLARRAMVEVVRPAARALPGARLGGVSCVMESRQI